MRRVCVCMRGKKGVKDADTNKDLVRHLAQDQGPAHKKCLVEWLLPLLGISLSGAESPSRGQLGHGAGVWDWTVISSHITRDKMKPLDERQDEALGGHQRALGD